MQTELTLNSPQEKKRFYKDLARITLPIAFQNFMDACVNSADVVMLTMVGKTELAAASLASKVAFVLQMLLFGVSSGASILSAQYWGSKDRRTIEKVLMISVRLSVGISLLFSLAAWFCPAAIMRIFTPDQALIEAGVGYLRAVSASYVLNGFAVVYLSVMRSVERVRMSAAVHSSAVVLNVVLNACFIFGVGFFPRLGIVGVALATSITRFLEVIVCSIDAARCKIIKLRIRDFLLREKALMREFFRYSIPAVLNDTIWGLAFSVYAVILGHLSSDIVAADSVASVVRTLCTVVCFGVSSAAAIMLGKTMGENRLADARVHAGRFLRMSVYTALAGGVIILLIRPFVLSSMHLMVDVNPVVERYTSLMLYINAYYIMGQSVNTMLICGIFRAGGDVRFGLVCDAIAMWGYAVPIGLLCAFVLRLPEMWVYFILCLDEFVKMPVIIAHYKKGTWLRNLTLNAEKKD